MKYSGKYQNGFTLIEVIAVLIILGIISVVVVSGSIDTETGLYSETEAIKTHFRYAQTQAMNRTLPSDPTPVLVWGITWNETSYWLFEGTTANVRVLPDNASGNDNKVLLATKKVGLLPSSFTVFFDGRGVPYSAYASETSNTPLAAALALTVTGNSSPTRTITITPLTGYIP